MGKALKCDLCENQATVHLTQILNNKVHKVDLCESCAQEKGVTDPNGFSLADLLAGSMSEEIETNSNDTICPICGYTRKDFRKTGRLGCPECYEHFGQTVRSLLDNMHKGTRHCGKIPTHVQEHLSYREEVSRLEEELQKAVEAERYEEAAEFRDQIEEVRKSRDKAEKDGR